MFNNHITLYYFTILCLVTSTIFTIFSNHVIFSLFFLVLSFIFASILLLLFECEFLALMFIIIYVGAIAVLLLFVVMMLEIKFKNLSQNLIVYLMSGLIYIILFNLIFFKQIATSFNLKTIQVNFYINWYDIISCIHETKIYSFVLYSHFCLQFLLVGFILLVSLIGIVCFTKSFFNKKTRDQSTFKQISTISTFLK